MFAVSAVVGQVLRPGVMGDELQAAGETFVQLGLQGVVVTRRVIAEEGNVLRPAVSGEVGSPLNWGTREPKPTTDGWLTLTSGLFA